MKSKTGSIKPDQSAPAATARTEAIAEGAETPASPALSSSVEFSMYVDAVDADSQVARLLYQGAAQRGSETWLLATLPLALLPTGTIEGAWLAMSLCPTPTPPGMDAGPLRAKLKKDDDGKDFAL